mgnify:CR=1 FL=1
MQFPQDVWNIIKQYYFDYNRIWYINRKITYVNWNIWQIWKKNIHLCNYYIETLKGLSPRLVLYLIKKN